MADSFCRCSSVISVVKSDRIERNVWCKGLSRDGMFSFQRYTIRFRMCLRVALELFDFFILYTWHLRRVKTSAVSWLVCSGGQPAGWLKLNGFISVVPHGRINSFMWTLRIRVFSRHTSILLLDLE